MVDVINTTSNQAFASAVRSRIRADGRIVNATAAGLRMVGIGAMLGLTSVGLGLGYGVACYGYARIYDPPMEKLTEAVVNALNTATLKGEVAIAPNSIIQVDSTGTAPIKLDGHETKVALDAGNASVKLNSNGATPIKVDPSGASIKVDTTSAAPIKIDASDATIKAAQSVPADWQGVHTNSTGGGPEAHKVTRNLTIFSSTPYANGSIVTGWRFDSSDDTLPKSQFCYYSKNLGGSSKLVINIAEDRLPLANVDGRGEINPAEAIKQCTWAN